MGDGSVPLLSCCVPYLYFDAFIFKIDGFGGELYSDSGFALVGELILFEA